MKLWRRRRRRKGEEEDEEEDNYSNDKQGKDRQKEEKKGKRTTMKRRRNRRWRRRIRRSKRGRRGGSIASQMFHGTHTAMYNEKLQTNICLLNKSPWSPFSPFPFQVTLDKPQAPAAIRCTQLP